MEVFGIKFIPWNTTLAEHIQTLAALSWPVMFIFYGLLSWPIFLYIIFFTRFYWLALLYICWMYYDKGTPYVGGRQLEFVRRLRWWNYYRDYFSLRLIKTHELDKSKNYLFCMSPHGLLCFGGFGTICTEAADISNLFQGFKIHSTTLTSNFFLPILRDILLALGMCSVSACSASYLLSYPDGGHITVIVLGGAEETFYSEPGTHKLVLRRRKGFVKLALMHGVPLVPVIVFGETDLYDLRVNEKSIFYKFQRKFKEITGHAPVFPNGRGLFQYSFGIVPRKVQLTTVVGKPLEVEHVENPTKEQIDDVHQKFLEHYVDLFETEKHKYIKNSEEHHVVFV